MQTRNAPLFCAVVLVGLLGSGCASPTGPAPGDSDAQHTLWTRAGEAERITILRGELAALCPKADPNEVAAVAEVAVRYGEVLREEYGLFRPVEVNNLLIRLGLKRRGLCFQLADDLFCRLRAMELRTLELHEAQAARGHLIDEHNVVVVTARDAPMKSGMVLDLWRYAGKVRWVSVVDDVSHDWIERPTLPAPSQLITNDYARVTEPTTREAEAAATTANQSPTRKPAAGTPDFSLTPPPP